MIGSGIFIVPAEMACYLGSPGWLVVAWGGTGVLTIAGAGAPEKGRTDSNYDIVDGH
jgi:hypothetical protein